MFRIRLWARFKEGIFYDHKNPNNAFCSETDRFYNVQKIGKALKIAKPSSAFDINTGIRFGEPLPRKTSHVFDMRADESSARIFMLFICIFIYRHFLSCGIF